MVVFALGCIITWRVNSWVKRRLDLLNQVNQLANGEVEVGLIERRTEAEIAQRTIDQVTELRKAKLAKETAETIAATAMVSELQQDKLQAERRILEARTAAQENLAEEFARAEHDTFLDREAAEEDPVDRYARLLAASSRAGVRDLSFDEFYELVTN